MSSVMVANPTSLIILHLHNLLFFAQIPQIEFDFEHKLIKWSGNVES